MQNFSALGCDNTEIAAYHWFRRFSPIFGSDTELIDPSCCITQDSLMANPRAKFQRFWLLGFDNTEVYFHPTRWH